MNSKTIASQVTAVIFAAFLITVRCAKKQLSTDPFEDSGAAAPSSSTGETATDRGGAFRSENIGEEDLDSKYAGAAYARQQAAAEMEAFENEDIYFEFDSAELTEEAQEILKRKTRWLADNPRIRVTIEGHCDDRGTNEYNLALGESRAQTAQLYIMTLGIDQSRITIVSYGEERPAVPGTSEEARNKNRRAHFVIAPAP